MQLAEGLPPTVFYYLLSHCIVIDCQERFSKILAPWFTNDYFCNVFVNHSNPMKAIFAKRLKSARLSASLSQDALVERIGGIVSKNAISKYERGLMMPDSKVLIALSKALAVKTDYFFREYSVSIGNVEFRKKSRLRVKLQNSIREQVADKVSRYLEIEQFLNIESEFSNPIKNIAVNSLSDIEIAVNQLLNTWNIGINAIPSVIDLLEDNEIKVVELQTDGDFEGFSGWADKKYPVIAINANYCAERKRFTALHELGHLLLSIDHRISDKEKEKMCHRFAGAMLIPEVTFRRELGPYRSYIPIPELINIKESYGISIQAIMARARDLKVIGDSTYTQFCIRISSNRKEEGLGHYTGKEKSTRFKQLVYRAASEEIISMSKAANLADQKLSDFRVEFESI